ncbi:MAG: GDP-mannose 4,6-dehydratase [Ignavibacteriae bacterium]|nr:GDP-mannose 4,6-dehydratase [Ignavibacteriota bacterium]MCB9242141.1 GDP-mannose 4,6-dehydratase [Ignavibacteriales bacterium]
MKKALITGVTGQDGAYLSELLLGKGYEVKGITRDGSDIRTTNLSYLGILNDIELIQADLLDLSNLLRVIKDTAPDEIYNLAAQSSVGLSFQQPIGTLEFNIISTANLLEAIRSIKPETKFYNASSSEMYGRLRPENLPVTEETVLHPVSPYSISKASAHWITINYREAYDLYAVCGILFNHESALRGENFVTKKILEGALRISKGMLDKITLGNLSISRDWGYAPEYIKAMWLMLQQETPDDYIICSGQANTLENFTKKVFAENRVDYDKHVEFSEKLYRPVDLEIIYGDNSKAKKNLDWKYDISFDELIKKLVEDESKFFEWKQSKGVN